MATPALNTQGLAGPGSEWFWVTQAMNETTPFPTATPGIAQALVAAPLLRKQLRAIRAVNGVTIKVQTPKGDIIALTMAAGDVENMGGVWAISGLAGDTDLLGYV